MNMHSPQRITFLFLIITLGVLGFVYYPKYQAQRAMTSRLTALLREQTGALSLGPRIKSANCAIRGSLPDHDCTPGAVFPNAVLEQICVPGYTKTVRKISLSLRKSAYAEYGVPYPQPRGSYELDHLVPLALGGDNDIANLFPQAAEPAPGFREKDIVENYLHQEVCSLRVALGVAQTRIADNWLDIYNNLSPEQIERLKAEFRNWSN